MRSTNLRSTRKQVITDPTVQGELLFRTLVYWFLCLTVVLLTTLGWSLWAGPPRPLIQVVQETIATAAPAVAGAVILLPLVLFDVLRVSNRFVGPVRQVRYALKQIALREESRRVYLRKDDFWQDLAHFTNMVAEEVEQSREQEQATEEDPEELHSTVTSS